VFVNKCINKLHYLLVIGKLVKIKEVIVQCVCVCVCVCVCACVIVCVSLCVCMCVSV
jgi:hypothetical protein